jgi:3-oxoacyl-[acyl-carrier-protein] synthase III
VRQLIKIISTGSYLPKKILSNADLEKIVDTTSDWIETRTGILNRRVATDEQTSDMAAKAALAAIEKSGYDIDKIDIIITATVSGDQSTPSTSNFIQSKIGLNHKNIMAFDVNAACTGFIYALEIASSLLQTGKYRAALIIGAETLTKLIDYTDRNTCVLFGDGAGAMILEMSGEEADEAHFYTASNHDLDSVLTIKDSLIRMDGKRVYAFAVKVVEDSIKKILSQADLKQSDIEVIIPHQANIRIIQSVAKSMEIPLDKFHMNIQNYGNTSAASIIIALDEYRTIHPEHLNKRALLVGFGGGFTWGSAIITL